jgi:hypothetical protein
VAAGRRLWKVNALLAVVALAFGGWMLRGMPRYHWRGYNGPIFLDWDGTQVDDAADAKFGVPTVDYGEPLGRQLNPTTIAMWGLDALVEDDISRARRAADWLVKNQAADGSWRYSFEWKRGKGPNAVVLDQGWASGLTTGVALSLFARLYAMTHDGRYAAAARQAVAFLDVPMTEGGVTTTLDGGVWFEEYPTPARASYVLNGFLFTLVGLWDIAPLVPDARTLYDDGRATLEANLHRWDSDGFVSYDLRSPWFDRTYDPIHAALLQAMIDERPSATVARWLNHWYG